MTKREIDALKILSNHNSRLDRITAKAFAHSFWPDKKDLFTKVSNQGNGACHGKAAWLCAGSYVGKLIKKGWVKHSFDDAGNGYFITELGRKELATATFIL